MALKSKSLADVRPDVPVHLAAPVAQRSGELVKINFAVPESVRRSWKLAALRRGTSVTKLILEAMEQHSHEA